MLGGMVERDPEPCMFMHGPATAVALADMPVTGEKQKQKQNESQLLHLHYECIMK
jgi:hypothetical protein